MNHNSNEPISRNTFLYSILAILVLFVAMILKLDVVSSGNNNFYRWSSIKLDRYGGGWYHGKCCNMICDTRYL